MTLNQFRDVLLTVTEKVYHFEAQGDTTREHIIWQETGSKTLHADDRRAEKVQQIQIDLYVPRDNTTLLPDLLDALEECDEIAYKDPVPVYEKETRLLRHIIECEVI